MELKESTFLTSDYTTNLHSSRLFDTDKDINIDNGTKIHAPMKSLCLKKEAKLCKGEKTVSSTSGAVNWSTMCKRMKIQYFLTPHTKINSNWIKDLNVRPETIKLLEENISRTLSNINHSKIFYESPLRVMNIKIRKWHLIKLKSFCTTKETTSKVKRQPSEWEKNNSKWNNW